MTEYIFLAIVGNYFASIVVGITFAIFLSFAIIFIRGNRRL